MGYCVTRGLKDDPNQVRQPKPYTAFEQGVAIKNDGLSKQHGVVVVTPRGALTVSYTHLTLPTNREV